MGTVIFCLDYDSLGNTRSLSKSVPPQTDVIISYVIWYIIKKPKDIYTSTYQKVGIWRNECNYKFPNLISF